MKENMVQKKDNLTKSLKEIEEIVDWFEGQDEVDLKKNLLGLV